MIVKVCGLKYEQNLLDISALNIDMVGFNFYPASPRYLGQLLPPVPEQIKKVGVFVNANLEEIEQKTRDYALDYVQLHGDETIDVIQKVQAIVPVIKVFRIGLDFNFKHINEYNFCTYFLFDTASPQFGGSGQRFDWELLHKMNIQTPFFLSGGLGLSDVSAIHAFKHPYFVGVDINSKFEISPGKKDVAMVQKFVKEINL